MIYPTFEEWERHQDPEQPADEEAAWNAACMVRDAEIADLKRQLRQALAQVEIVDRALGDPGNTSSKVALDAHEVEVRNRALEEAAGAIESHIIYTGPGAIDPEPIQIALALRVRGMKHGK